MSRAVAPGDFRLFALFDSGPNFADRDREADDAAGCHCIDAGYEDGVRSREYSYATAAARAAAQKELLARQFRVQIVTPLPTKEVGT